MFKTGLVARLNNWWFGMFHFPGGWSESDFYQSSKMNNRGQKIFISSYTFLTHTHTHTFYFSTLSWFCLFVFLCFIFLFSVSFLHSYVIIFLAIFLSLCLISFIFSIFVSLLFCLAIVFQFGPLGTFPGVRNELKSLSGKLTWLFFTLTFFGNYLEQIFGN